jgi:hypothetical protein
MRIQETNGILKEARIARNHQAAHQEDTGLMSRAWRMVSSLPHKLTSMFHK